MSSKLFNFIVALVLFLSPAVTFSQAPDLGTADNFVLFSADGAIVNTGISQITGKVGTNNGSPTGFGNVNGGMHASDGVTAQAAADLMSAYNELNNTIPEYFPAPLLGNGQIFTAGVYSISAAATLNSDLTFDAEGNSDAVFIVQIGGAFSAAANSSVNLINGAQACNVFWKIEGLVDLAAGTTMRGTVVVNNAAINLHTKNTLEGRVLTTNGAVTVEDVFAYTPIGCGSPDLLGPSAPTLGSAACYGIFSSDGPVTNAGITNVIGDVGTNVGLTIGFNPLLVTGEIHPIPDGSTAQAAADLLIAYNYLNLLPHDIELMYPAQFGANLVLTPHTYVLDGATTLTDTLYLNAGGKANAVFVIKINGALSAGSYSTVVLTNGALAENVYWMINGAVDINDYSVFNGTIISQGAINLYSGATINGRTFTGVGAIATNAVTSAADISPDCGSEEVEKPVLLSPTDDSEINSQSVTLEWMSFLNADKYILDVSLDSTFTNKLVDAEELTSNTRDLTDLTWDQSYYWRVKAVVNDVETEWSEVFSFFTVEVESPTLTIPVNGYQGTIIDVQVFWNTVPEAVSYNAQASTDPTFADAGQLLLDINTMLPSATIMDVDYGTTVYWRAQTVTATGTSYWSAAYSFTTIPEPVITGNDDICVNSSGMYSVQVNPNINYQIDYQWSVVGGIINGSSTGTTVDVTFDTPGEGEVTVMRTAAQWDEYSDSYTLDISLNSSVDMMTEVDLMSYYEDILCLNELVTFTAEENVLFPVENYAWWLIDGENETLLSTDDWVAYQFPTAGMFTIELRATSPSYCGVSTVSTEIEIDDTCPIMIDVPDMSACRYEPATFSSSVWGGDGNYTYYWHPANHLDNANIAEPTILSVLWDQNYTIQVQDGNGMFATDYSYVTVKTSAVVNTKSFDIIDNDEYIINLYDYLTSMYNPNATYNWYYMSGGNVVDIVDPTNEPSVQPYGFRKYYVTITDAEGCTSRPAYVNTFKRISKEITENDIVAGLNGGSIMASYPNPVDTKVNVYAEFAETSDITVKIVDLLGNTTVVDHGFGLNVYEKSIDMSNFTSGVYVIVIDSGNDSIVKRVIKQ